MTSVVLGVSDDIMNGLVAIPLQANGDTNEECFRKRKILSTEVTLWERVMKSESVFELVVVQFINLYIIAKK